MGNVNRRSIESISQFANFVAIVCGDNLATRTLASWRARIKNPERYAWETVREA